MARTQFAVLYQEDAEAIVRERDRARRVPKVTRDRTDNWNLDQPFAIVAVAPSGGIGANSAEQCQVQSVDSASSLSNAGWLADVYNVFGTAVTADAVIVCVKERVTGRYVVVSEDCP